MASMKTALPPVFIFQIKTHLPPVFQVLKFMGEALKLFKKMYLKSFSNWGTYHFWLKFKKLTLKIHDMKQLNPKDWKSANWD